jgi:hypothetical protein
VVCMAAVLESYVAAEGDMVVVAASGDHGGHGGGLGACVMALEVRPWWATTNSQWARAVVFCFFYSFREVFAESFICFSTHVCREGLMGLSAQSSLPGRRCRVPYVEGKPACAESTRLSAKAANPIVSTANHDAVARWSSSPPSLAETPPALRS